MSDQRDIIEATRESLKGEERMILEMCIRTALICQQQQQKLIMMHRDPTKVSD